FASPHGDADVMIEELIRSNSAPRGLTVVSSDHRLQRAARRRRATAVDSDVWYAEIVRSRQQRQESVAETSARPPVPLLQEDVNYWIRQFGGESALIGFIEQELEQLAGKPPASEKPTPKPPPEPETAPDKPTPQEAADFDSPFPPGYGEDLLEDDDLI
ncbi:MAG: NYN domain-containing protein, partial [Candidatus Nealsonbacteria bacterium]|nr:NYN domain-containing protein [Candidatus Nealsonbacteria bacterium]